MVLRALLLISRRAQREQEHGVVKVTIEDVKRVLYHHSNEFRAGLDVHVGSVVRHTSTADEGLGAALLCLRSP